MVLFPNLHSWHDSHPKTPSDTIAPSPVLAHPQLLSRGDSFPNSLPLDGKLQEPSDETFQEDDASSDLSCLDSRDFSDAEPELSSIHGSQAAVAYPKRSETHRVLNTDEVENRKAHNREPCDSRSDFSTAVPQEVNADSYSKAIWEDSQQIPTLSNEPTTTVDAEDTAGQQDCLPHEERHDQSPVPTCPAETAEHDVSALDLNSPTRHNCSRLSAQIQKENIEDPRNIDNSNSPSANSSYCSPDPLLKTSHDPEQCYSTASPTPLRPLRNKQDVKRSSARRIHATRSVSQTDPLNLPHQQEKRKELELSASHIITAPPETAAGHSDISEHYKYHNNDMSFYTPAIREEARAPSRELSRLNEVSWVPSL